MKVLNVRPHEWSYDTEGVLFSRRVNLHLPTKYTLFLLMYNRQSVLPTDIQYSLSTTNDADKVEYLFNEETFDTMLSATFSLR